MILSLSEEVFELSLYFYLQKPGAGKTTLTFTVSVNVLSAKFPFCVVPVGREGGGNGKYVDVSRKR
jgi:hypothetical protein